MKLSLFSTYFEFGANTVMVDSLPPQIGMSICVEDKVAFDVIKFSKAPLEGHTAAAEQKYISALKQVSPPSNAAGFGHFTRDVVLYRQLPPANLVLQCFCVHLIIICNT